VGEYSFERVFVDYCCNSFFSTFAQAAYNPPGAIHEDVGIGAQNSGRQDNAKPDDGANGDFRIHVEQDAACGNVGSFGEMLVGVARSNGNGKLEREPYGISEIRHHCVFTHAPVYTPSLFPTKVTLVSWETLKDMLKSRIKTL
jgi:hypothetical protein